MTGQAELEFTDAARSDLIHLRRYSLEHFGPQVADRYVDSIKSVFELLQEMPLAGQALPEMGGAVRCYSRKRHRVFYQVTNNVITILRILHHARDIRRALKP